MTNHDKATIDQLLALDLRELYITFGEELPAEASAAGLQDPYKKARDWLTRKRGQIYDIVCAEDNWPALSRKLDKSSTADAVVAIVDAWLAPHFVGLPVTKLAVILVKEGLDTICGC